MKKNEVKERILRETIRLMEERGASPQSVTIRDISAAAGVGVGLINYHFQTKEALIRQCVQVIVGDTIGRFGEISRSLSGEPIDKLKHMVKATCRYLADHENLSRISILTDMSEEREGDNTSQTMEAYLPLVREVCGKETPEDAVRRKTLCLLYALQGAFLRPGMLQAQLGVDFRFPQQREQLIEQIIDLVFA